MRMPPTCNISRRGCLHACMSHSTFAVVQLHTRSQCRHTGCMTRQTTSIRALYPNVFHVNLHVADERRCC
eukprot:363920-Chlamydomonas_euryale.AAC.10